MLYQTAGGAHAQATNVGNLKAHQPFHIQYCTSISDYEDCFVTIKYYNNLLLYITS